MGMAERKRQAGHVAALLSLAFAVLAGAAILVMPWGALVAAESAVLLPSGQVVVTRPAGEPMPAPRILDVEGPSILPLLAIPILIAAGGVAVRTWRHVLAARTAASFLLMNFVLFGAMSIGLFYVPSGAAMVASAIQGGQAWASGDDG